jgi:hypothetical protein
MIEVFFFKKNKLIVKVIKYNLKVFKTLFKMVNNCGFITDENKCFYTIIFLIVGSFFLVFGVITYISFLSTSNNFVLLGLFITFLVLGIIFCIFSIVISEIHKGDKNIIEYVKNGININNNENDIKENKIDVGKIKKYDKVLNMKDL